MFLYTVTHYFQVRLSITFNVRVGVFNALLSLMKLKLGFWNGKVKHLYPVKYTGYRPITAVKQFRACKVSGWVTIENSDQVRLSFWPNPGRVSLMWIAILKPSKCGVTPHQSRYKLDQLKSKKKTVNLVMEELCRYLHCVSTLLYTREEQLLYHSQNKHHYPPLYALG